MQETQAGGRMQTLQLWPKAHRPERGTKKNSSPFLLPRKLQMLEVSETVTCWISRDLVGEAEAISAPALTPLPSLLVPARAEPRSPGVAAHGRAAAGVDAPGAVGVPSEHAVSAGAVLHTVGQGQLDQLGAGARKEQLLPEKHRRAVSQARTWPGGGSDHCQGAQGAPKRKGAALKS